MISIKHIYEFLIILIFLFIGTVLEIFLKSPIPATILSMLFLVALLYFKIIDLNALKSYLSQDVKLLGYGPMIGISTESIKTRTFTRYELEEIKKAQKYIRDYYIEKIGKETLKDYLSSFARYIVSFLLGRLDIIDRQNTGVMLRWISDGIDLIDKALDTGRSRVTMKFMKLTWKTTGFSVITGGIISQ